MLGSSIKARPPSSSGRSHWNAGWGGTGTGTSEPITSSALCEFLERIPDFERALRGYSQDGNRELLAKLEEVLAAVRGSPPADQDDPTVA